MVWYEAIVELASEIVGLVLYLFMSLVVREILFEASAYHETVCCMLVRSFDLASKSNGSAISYIAV